MITTKPLPGSVYVRYEVIRTFRNWRLLFFSLLFPLILFLIVAGSNRHARLDGVSFSLYYMTGMAAWGGMVAVISTGGNFAIERQLGWTRQLRITPLRRRTYFQTKVLCGYLMAVLNLAVLYIAGAAIGVSVSVGAWTAMTGLILVGLLPFALLGILLGHLLKADSLGPAIGGVTSLLALLGGAWGPLATSGVFLNVVKVFPSYWLVQAGKTGIGGHGWPVEAWAVLGIWVLGLGWLAQRVYLRDTARV
jgi:ABC-2 type transport system permease protein